MPAEFLSNDAPPPLMGAPTQTTPSTNGDRAAFAERMAKKLTPARPVESVSGNLFFKSSRSREAHGTALINSIANGGEISAAAFDAAKSGWTPDFMISVSKNWDDCSSFIALCLLRKGALESVCNAFPAWAGTVGQGEPEGAVAILTEASVAPAEGGVLFMAQKLGWVPSIGSVCKAAESGGLVFDEVALALGSDRGRVMALASKRISETFLSESFPFPSCQRDAPRSLSLTLAAGRGAFPAIEAACVSMVVSGRPGASITGVLSNVSEQALKICATIPDDVVKHRLCSDENPAEFARTCLSKLGAGPFEAALRLGDHPCAIVLSSMGIGGSPLVERPVVVDNPRLLSWMAENGHDTSNAVSKSLSRLKAPEGKKWFLDCLGERQSQRPRTDKVKTMETSALDPWFFLAAGFYARKKLTDKCWDELLNASNALAAAGLSNPTDGLEFFLGAVHEVTTAAGKSAQSDIARPEGLARARRICEEASLFAMPHPDLPATKRPSV